MPPSLNRRAAALGPDLMTQRFLSTMSAAIDEEFGLGDEFELLSIIRAQLLRGDPNTSWTMFSFRICKSWSHYRREANFPNRVPDDSGPLVDSGSLWPLVFDDEKPLMMLEAFFHEASRQIDEYYEQRELGERIPTPGIAAERKDSLSSGVPAMVATPAPKAPKTLQEQIDAEWQEVTDGAASGTAAFRAWEVPVPAWIDPAKHIFSNTPAITTYFNGLELFHNPYTNTIRPVLPLSEGREQAQIPRPARLICHFLRANTELWRWVEEIKREKTMTPLEQWMQNESELELERVEELGRKSVKKNYTKWAEHAGFGLERDYSVA